jgi:hypothetical protein
MTLQTNYLADTMTTLVIDSEVTAGELALWSRNHDAEFPISGDAITKAKEQK